MWIWAQHEIPVAKFLAGKLLISQSPFFLYTYDAFSYIAVEYK